MEDENPKENPEENPKENQKKTSIYKMDNDDDRKFYQSIKNIDELCENLKKCGRTNSEIAWFRNEYEKYKTIKTDI